jgi:FkbM family methyltransferase
VVCGEIAMNSNRLVDVLRPVMDLIEGPLVVVDVGAQSLRGERHIYSSLYELDLPVRVVGFEPLPDRAAARREEENGRDTLILEAFVGSGEELTFYENTSSGTSSLLPLNCGVCSGFMSLANLRTTGRQQVKTSKLDDVLGDVPAVDFLKLDIQGFELNALQGAGTILERTAMVQCETEFVPIYSGQPLFAEVEQYLRGCRFAFLDFHLPAYRAPVVPSGRIRNEQLLWADAIFGAQLATASDRAVLAQAIMAIALYRKLSVGERALAVYDARNGTELAQTIASLG